MIVDDDALLAELVAQSLRHNGLTTCVTGDATSVRAAMASFDPDAVIVDIGVGDAFAGVDLVDDLHRTAPHVGIVVLTHVTAPGIVGADLPPTASIAYLRKQDVRHPREILHAIDSVLSDDPVPPPRHDQAGDGLLDRLTPKQLETLRLVAAGQTNAEIAAARGTSVRAVEYLVARTFARVGIDEATRGRRRIEAARLFVEACGGSRAHRE